MNPSLLTPQTLPMELERAFQRATGTGNLAGALKELWPWLAKESGAPRGKDHYSQKQMMARAYGAYYGPANVLKLPAILDEMAHFGLPLPGKEVRVLDVGCGPGTASAGAGWWLKERNLGVSAVGLDWSAEFLTIASSVMSTLGLTFHAKKADWSQPGVLVSTAKEARPHLVVASNALNEVRREPAALATLWAEVLADLTLSTKRDHEPRYLILLEPGSRDASRRLLQMREALLERMPAGASLVLPCLDARPCGALVDSKDWCHEDVAVTMPAWHEDLGKAAGLFKESLIFSYLVFAVLPEGMPANFPTGGARVVSQRMEEKGLTKCFVCTATLGKRLARVLNARRAPENEALATCHRGQVFTTLELSEKGDVNRAAAIADYP